MSPRTVVPINEDGTAEASGLPSTADAVRSGRLQEPSPEPLTVPGSTSQEGAGPLVCKEDRWVPGPWPAPKGSPLEGGMTEDGESKQTQRKGRPLYTAGAWGAGQAVGPCT